MFFFCNKGMKWIIYLSFHLLLYLFSLVMSLKRSDCFLVQYLFFLTIYFMQQNSFDSIYFLLFSYSDERINSSNIKVAILKICVREFVHVYTSCLFVSLQWLKYRYCYRLNCS